MRPEVIGKAVDNHGLPDDITDTETICPYSKERFAATGQQREKVSCVIRMGLRIWIIMSARSGKTDSGTGFTIVDMHSEKIRRISGESGEPGYHQNAPALLTELYLSG